MKKEILMELYTRPTCSDCQEAKKFLASNHINYVDKDVSRNEELEQDMRKIAGNRIVPLFVFYQTGLFGRKKLLKHFTGYENNREEIHEWLFKKSLF
ncbi:glutaredoxin family protein [Cytobacillus sp. FJAT-54145]|uniref:Glutaredoxin family protein n=1 Tax=Cytobacillus spartinae TaxID=3299023 RepID=A0ABW6KH33_9BACI